MTEAVGTRISTYIRTHKVAVRSVLFILALVLVVSQASNIEDFFLGFYDGLGNTGPR